MNKKLLNLLAITIGIVPVNGFMIWYRLTHSAGFTLSDMLAYPLIIGGGNILLILGLNKYLLKEKWRIFNPGKGKRYCDILSGVLLAAIYFGLMFAERTFLLPLFPPSEPPSQEVIDLMTGLAQNPLLLAFWLGPVVWIGVALFEELSRVFFMNCLWKLASKKYWQISVIALVAVITGITHLYQGPFGIVSVTIQGLVAGSYFYHFRRIMPLVISHALFDSFQIIGLVIQVT